MMTHELPDNTRREPLSAKDTRNKLFTVVLVLVVGLFANARRERERERVKVDLFVGDGFAKSLNAGATLEHAFTMKTNSRTSQDAAGGSSNYSIWCPARAPS